MSDYNPNWSFISGAIGASVMMWIVGYAAGSAGLRFSTFGVHGYETGLML